MPDPFTLSLPQLLEWLKENRFISPQGAVGFFVFMTLEEMGLPAPFVSTSILFIIGLGFGLGQLGYGEVVASVILVVLASLLGPSIPYWFGRSAARALLLKATGRLRLGPHLQKVEAKLQQMGARGVFMGRLTPGLLLATSVAAGTLRVPFGAFLGASVASALVWSGAWLTVGYLTARFGMELLPALRYVPLAVVVLLLVIVGVSFKIRRAVKLQRLRSQ